MATFWGKSCSFNSVDRMLSLYCILILVISRFGFEGRISVLIVPGPGYCFSFTFVIRT